MKSGYEQFQEDWERDAKQERESYDVLCVVELLALIRAGQYGNYYRIWYSLAEKTTLAEAGWLLFDVLNSKADYLIRYHSAAALILIGGEIFREWEPVMLSGEEKYPVRDNLEKVESVLVGLLGER